MRREWAALWHERHVVVGVVVARRADRRARARGGIDQMNDHRAYVVTLGDAKAATAGVSQRIARHKVTLHVDDDERVVRPHRGGLRVHDLFAGEVQPLLEERRPHRGRGERPAIKGATQGAGERHAAEARRVGRCCAHPAGPKTREPTPKTPLLGGSYGRTGNANREHPRNTQVLRTSPSGFGNGAASTAGVLGAPNTEAHIVDAFEPPPSRLSALPARCHQDW